METLGQELPEKKIQSLPIQWTPVRLFTPTLSGFEINISFPNFDLTRHEWSILTPRFQGAKLIWGTDNHNQDQPRFQPAMVRRATSQNISKENEKQILLLKTETQLLTPMLLLPFLQLEVRLLYNSTILKEVVTRVLQAVTKWSKTRNNSPSRSWEKFLTVC